MATQICPTDCTSELPDSLFSRCAPETNAGEIEKILMGEEGTTFAAYAEEDATATELGAFATELLALITAGTVKVLTVIADKPAPGDNKIPMSGGRTIQGNRDHVVNFTIDETNSTNHKWVQRIECGGQYPFWYITSGGKFYGGATGIDASFSGSVVIPRDRKALITIDGTASWSSKFTEDRTISPLS
jgi:hypothetical protein